MKRFKHPVRAIREPFGTAGLIVAVVALVFAMLGGAYAATNSGGKATASAKAKPGPRGKTGKTGPAGPAGAAGPAGPAGPKGTNGEPGAPGEPGKEGKEGALGTAGTTLPPGATETGTWTTPTRIEKEYTAVLSPISFTVPLAAPLSGSHVFDVSVAEQQRTNGDTPPAACQGTVTEPTATAGNLCVYEGFSTGPEVEVEPGVEVKIPPQVRYIDTPTHGTPGELGADTSGAFLLIEYQGPDTPTVPATLVGTWAVTG